MARADVPTPGTQTLTDLAEGPVLLFDGECGVCAASVQWVLAHERRSQDLAGALRFAALQSPAGRSFLASAGLRPDVDSLIWLEAQGTSVRAHYYADAVHAVLRYVGGRWQVLRVLLGLVPGPLRDLGYRIFARHRLALAARQCLVPTPTQKARFFEQLAKPVGH